MQVEVLAAAVGLCIYAMRVLPLMLDLGDVPQGGRLARFFAATGVAAIATLFAAGFLPNLSVATVVGSVGVIISYYATRSVVGATLVGALIYGIAFAYV